MNLKNTYILNFRSCPVKRNIGKGNEWTQRLIGVY